MKPTIQSLLAASAVSLSLLAAPAPAADTIYKWVDEKGVTQYGSRPPSGHTDRAKLIQGQSFSQSRRPGSELYEDTESSDAAPAEEGTEEDNAAAADAEDAAGEATATPQDPVDAEASEQAALEMKIKAHNCQKARQTLKVLNENTRVQVKNDKGEMVFMTAPQMAERRKQAEQVAAENCT